MRSKITKKVAKAVNVSAAVKFSRVSFGKKIPKMPSMRGMPNEVKLVGALMLMLAALYVFQLISTPSFLKSQVKGVTGFVVADTTQQQQTVPPPQRTTTTPTSTSQPATKKETKLASPTPAPSVQQTPAASLAPFIKIVEPAKGSTVSPGFTVKVEFNKDGFICYYQVKDNGGTTWDRRMRPCKTEFSVNKEYCSTVGKNTCFVHVDAANQDNSLTSTDEAYYSIQ